MVRMGLPRRRRTRVLLLIATALVVYVVALSAIPALLGGDGAAERRARGQRAIQAENWGLVLPDDREALGQAIDDAWRALASYRMRYVSGTPAGLAAGQVESEAGSAYQLRDGRILAQRDTTFISTQSPASGGKEERLEGFRVRTDRPYVSRRGLRIDSELVYRRAVAGAWACERVPADRSLPPAPALDLTAAGDAGFSDIDGRRVRAFQVPAGAFGLRAPATVWIELDTLRIRRQEIESVLPGRHEVWTWEGFDEPVEITPPQGIPCQET
jgi:hypothetical protein